MGLVLGCQPVWMSNYLLKPPFTFDSAKKNLIHIKMSH